MKTQADTDLEMLELIRSIDPMLDPRVQADAGLDTEAALRVLAPQLHRPAPPRRIRRRHRAVLRLALLAASAGTAAFVVANVVSSGTDFAVPTAQAKMMIVRARAALVDLPAAILEEDVVTTVTAADGTTSTLDAHQWISTSPPYDSRQILTQDGVQYENWTVNGRPDLYDPATNTVYVAPANVLAPGGNLTLTTARAEIRYLIAGYACPDCSGHTNVVVNPSATVNGNPAIEFTFLGGQYSYWASPSDYRPLQFEDRKAVLPDGQSGVALAHYPIDRLLTGAAASASLVSLDAQHPGATIDESDADYQAFVQRVIPNIGNLALGTGRHPRLRGTGEPAVP
jgi:hypothetical protein